MALNSIYGAEKHQFRTDPYGLYFGLEHSISLDSRFDESSGGFCSLHYPNFTDRFAEALAKVLAAVWIPSPVG